MKEPKEKTFRELLCEAHQIPERDFTRFVLRRTLFRRTRMVAPFVMVLYPDFLHHETRLVERAGRATNLDLIQFEVDFYHHKFVIESAWKDVMSFRLSGMRLMRLAHSVFKNQDASAPAIDGSLSAVNS